MATQEFDELNLFGMATKWIDKVDVSDEEKKKRVNLAMDYCEIMIMLFFMITEEDYEREDCIAFAEERIKILAERELGTENIAYINDWAPKKATEIVDTTYEKYENEIEDAILDDGETSNQEDGQEKEHKQNILNFKELGVEIPEDEYWLSRVRALFVGLELSMTVCNFEELNDAMKEGKTRKTWMTEADERVRETHQALHGVDIPINEFFTVGNSQMLMPGDSLNGAELSEIANCRCHLVCH